MSDGSVGEIELRSEGLMRSYLGVDPSKTFVEDRWFPTGDLGYMSDGELFVTGRIKDVLIVMGTNYAPEDIEWAAERVGRVRKGRCIAFGGPDEDGEIVVALEARDDSDVAQLSSEVSRSIASTIGVTPTEVLVLPKGTVPKTTSGKLRRSTVREAYDRKELEPLI
jgi:acyl-CoA synthetase (AMP-forming)/AMP-acid ligase II